ncbi:probable inactive heme oxygenase 2, chloroplastic [Andrographis paniculata]|uniref:probable inactive heme oxygenase 2, chloroplastic n=1 Tax=Andrographis paniculata TaxID=175694 RepID=UPI0021E78690|nr:probable inactive heme oxygenase 2, chloroplastic [Andrographis paniculata]
MAGCCCSPPAALNPSVSLILRNSSLSLLEKVQLPRSCFMKLSERGNFSGNGGFHLNQCTRHCTRVWVSEAGSEYETEGYDSSEERGVFGEEKVPKTVGIGQPPPPVRRRLRRYRKEYPGEKKGISEEMRFVAMKLRNDKSKRKGTSTALGETDEEQRESIMSEGNSSETNGNDEKIEEAWQPSVEGFLKYLVDSELVFSTIERIVDESSDVSYVYFRKTGLERSASISRDLEWFRERGIVIPEPSNPGVEYARYLEELAEKTPPLFFSHFYNIYFSHIAGGKVIAKQVSDKLFEGRELEFNRWDGDAEELLRDVREKLNALGEHWTRDEKNKCLKETTKAFRFLGQIVRLIILI